MVARIKCSLLPLLGQFERHKHLPELLFNWLRLNLTLRPLDAQLVGAAAVVALLR
jgi:hypothetical protein